jgi:hypothetical protein
MRNFCVSELQFDTQIVTVLQSCMCIPKFRRRIWTPSSGSKLISICKIADCHNPENHTFVLQNKMHLFSGGWAELIFFSFKSQLLCWFSEFHVRTIRPNKNLLANSIYPKIIHLKLFNNAVSNSNCMVLND